MHFEYKFGRTNSHLNGIKSFYSVDTHFINQEIKQKYSIEWKAKDA